MWVDRIGVQDKSEVSNERRAIKEMWATILSGSPSSEDFPFAWFLIAIYESRYKRDNIESKLMNLIKVYM